MNKKRMNYAEHQYKLAYSMIREARRFKNYDGYFQSIWEAIDLNIEESYLQRAVRSLTLSERVGFYGVNFWQRLKTKNAWRDGLVWRAIAINEHIKTYFKTF